MLDLELSQALRASAFSPAHACLVVFSQTSSSSNQSYKRQGSFSVSSSRLLTAIIRLYFSDVKRLLKYYYHNSCHWLCSQSGPLALKLTPSYAGGLLRLFLRRCWGHVPCGADRCGTTMSVILSSVDAVCICSRFRALPSQRWKQGCARSDRWTASGA